jgi:hypothetical protein
MAVKELGVWVLGRIVFAVVFFQFLGAVPWEPGLGPVVRLIAIAATPGSIELIAVVGWVLSEDY